VLAAMAGRDPLDPSSVDKKFTWPDMAKPKGEKFKIGVVKGSATGVQPAVKKNFDDSLKVLAKFADVEDAVALPDLPFGPVVGTIVGAEGASAFHDLLESGAAMKLRAPRDRTGAYSAAMTLAVDYLQAMRLRGPMKKAMDELYSRYDALIAPSRPTVALPLDRDFAQAYPGISGGPPLIPAGNVVGQPAVSILNGFGDKNLPTGIQFTGRAWSEARLLTLAALYQRETEWHKKRPKL
jgi:aspartyl-tRNA(Asn)/glutamyl-tRNA(Gln) amidotransferase subunit A